MISGALALAATAACAQATLTLTVGDSSGAAVPGAVVRDATGRRIGQTDASGQVTVRCDTPCHLRLEAPDFAEQDLTLTGNATVQLHPAAATERVTVTAYRAPLGDLESPAITRQLSQQALETTAAVSLDDKLRQIPGVELFRRSSSLVANPTSQGISLRALGSTSASRTLVTADDVPLNDPVGGWIHWEEQPELALEGVELVRGAASDLYGSSAIGGVVNFRLAQPSRNAFQLRSTYGGESTYEDSVLAEGKRGPWGALFAGTMLGTDGYIQEAPWQRGPIDVNSNVHARNALAAAEYANGPLRLFARTSGFEENRHNGTPYQINTTRLWRYVLGSDWQGPHEGSLAVRVYGSSEGYHQTFSSISDTPTATDPACIYRCSETPTKISTTPANELGASAQWSQPLAPGLLLLGGGSVHDVRVWDREQVLATASLTNLHVHQRDPAAYAELMATRKAWTIAASGRIDWFQNYDVRQLEWTGSAWIPSATQPPTFDERVFDPRLGIARKIGAHWALSASGYRAFRAPTPSELYRSTQVGNQLTKANGALRSERATGWEAGIAMQRTWGDVRASWFDTQINRPISAVTIDPNSSPILLKRENLGQIESRGISLDFQFAPRSWLALDGGYQYAHATVTSGTQDLGNWIPEVPRNMATLNVRAFKPRLGALSLQGRMSGRQYNNDENTEMLHGYFRLDAYASHTLGGRFDLFAAGENLFDRTIEVGESPTVTLGQPRMARAGITVRLGRDSK